MLFSISSKYSYFKSIFNHTKKRLWKGNLIYWNCDTLMCFCLRRKIKKVGKRKKKVINCCHYLLSNKIIEEGVEKKNDGLLSLPFCSKTIVKGNNNCHCFLCNKTIEENDGNCCHLLHSNTSTKEDDGSYHCIILLFKHKKKKKRQWHP